MGSAELPLRVCFRGDDDHADAMSALALAPFVTGENPFVEELEVAGVRRAADLVPGRRHPRWRLIVIEDANEPRSSSRP